MRLSQRMDSAKPNQLSPWAKKSLSFLIWMSPMFSLGPFLAIGVLFAFPREYRLRLSAIFLITIYLFSWAIFYPLELLHRSSLEWEATINEFISTGNFQTKATIGFLAFYFILLFANYIHSYKRNSKREFVRKQSLQSKNPNSSLRSEKQIRDSKFDTLLLEFFLALFLCFIFQFVSDSLHPPKPLAPLAPIVSVYQLFFNYSLSLAILVLSFNRNKIPSLAAPIYLSYTRGIRLREFWRKASFESKHFPFRLELSVKAKAQFREKFLPGLGHLYLYEYWRGFPILFLGLLLWLFLAVWVFSYISPIFGIQFLAGFGLKPGIPDKNFFQTAQNVSYAILSLVTLIGLYFYSSYILEKSFSLENLGLKKPKDGEREPFFEPGIKRGFKNVLPVSLLFHLVLLCLVFLIPISLQRSGKKDKSSQKAENFKPEKMEFYFIDPNIPNEMEGLNGGVITGNETTNQTEGEKIKNEKLADNGPVKGNIKKIRGKKVPATYSNYISAKMRIPESYMDYWAKAPHPYSSVVAYTITQDGDVIDVELVEASDYPDQDLRTLQLVESLGPLMPPPGTKNDIRVTELFWNGPIDPDFVDTPLQKEMINMFDGRYMEELPE
ncbi:energy transducer TonB [Leptospira sp. 96542]|nr:energy transducer TonB [Leptospira sp. 96542]